MGTNSKMMDCNTTVKILKTANRFPIERHAKYKSGTFNKKINPPKLN